MAKVYKYDEYNTNEEFLGGLINFFKGLFKKMAAQIQKLNDDPNTIKDFVLKNLLDPNSQTSIFKKELDDIKIGDDTQDADCFRAIDSILNKESGALGKQGIGLLLNDKALQGDNQKVKRLTIEYIVNTARDQVSKKIGYDPSKVNDPTWVQKLNILKPTGGTASAATEAIVYNYSSMLKLYEAGTPTPAATQANPAPVPAATQANPAATPAAATPAGAVNEKTTTVKKWVTDNIVTVMNNYVKAIKEDDIKAAVAKGGGSTETSEMNYDTLKELFDAGTPVIYLLKGKTKDQYNPKIPPGQQTGVVGVKKISTINDQSKEDSVVFLDKDNNPTIKKSYGEIIGAANAANNAPEVEDLKKELAKMKGNAEQMTKVLNYTKWIAEHPNEPYIEPTVAPAG